MPYTTHRKSDASDRQKDKDFCTCPTRRNGRELTAAYYS